MLDKGRRLKKNELNTPPYADKRDYGNENSSISPDEYVEWFLPKRREIYRVLKPTGSFVLNISDKVVDGFQHLYVFELLLRLCKEVGFHLVRDYIWYNPATPPNVYSRGGYGRTKKSHEYCFWFSKGSDWTFELDPIRKPYSKDMQKYLDGKGKCDRSENIRPSTHNFNCEKVWTNNGGSDPGTVIEIANTSSNDVFMKLYKEKGIAHPARFPEKLAEFFILSGSVEGDVILEEEYIEMCAEKARKEARDVLDHYMQPFELVDKRFYTNNMTVEEHKRIVKEMEKPADKATHIP